MNVPQSEPQPAPSADEQAKSVIQLEAVHHRFGRQQVLKGIDLIVNKGECVVLYGSNGSGKSTLLALLSTRYQIRQGRYLLDGNDANKNGDEVRDKLVFIGHHTHLYGHLTPLENLQFFTDLRGLSLLPSHLREAVAAVGLERMANKPVQWFSAGMKKRVALARMLLANPLLLLLDEPYSALDAQGVSWLNTILTQYLNQGGAIVMASHDPERVAALSHTPYHLAQGHLSVADKTETLSSPEPPHS